jgi:hypothetical protein
MHNVNREGVILYDAYRWNERYSNRNQRKRARPFCFEDFEHSELAIDIIAKMIGYNIKAR